MSIRVKIFAAVVLFTSILYTPSLEADFIGIFADDMGYDCMGNIPEYEPFVVHVMAYIPNFPEGITGAEFQIDNLPGNPGFPIGTSTETWDGDTVIGDASWDLTILFDEPRLGYFAHLGSIEFLMFDRNWIGEDYILNVSYGRECNRIQLFDYIFEEWVYVDNGKFTFNCSSYLCHCEGLSARENSWSTVKALF